jgi:hypothetical protein
MSLKNMSPNLQEKRKMNDQEVRADLIEVIESGVLKTEHVFQYGGGILGVLNLKAGRTEGIFKTEDNKEYVFKKTSFWKSFYEWKDYTIVVASAKPARKFSRAFLIEFQGATYGLFPGGSKLRSWKVKNISSQALCEIYPRGAFKRGARVKISAEIPTGLLAFCYCLVTKRWQEQSS